MVTMVTSSMQNLLDCRFQTVQRISNSKQYIRQCGSRSIILDVPQVCISYGSKVMSILRKGVCCCQDIENTKKWAVFCDFDCRKLFFMQNKHDIRNQHEKIRHKSYFYCEIFPIKILALVPLSLLFLKFPLWSPTRKILIGNISQ